MREFRTPGSVRGAPGNGRPYRDISPSTQTQMVLLWLTMITRRLVKPSTSTGICQMPLYFGFQQNIEMMIPAFMTMGIGFYLLCWGGG